MPLAVALCAALPRLGPALRGYNPSPDAAEYLLIARSLARGEGFTLPIRVRFPGRRPVVHEAYGERAPLWPWLLSAVVGAAGQAGSGWPDPRLQLLNVLLAALGAALATELTWVVARRRGLVGGSRVLAALLGGLAVAWAPGFVRASVHLWAEPLGAVLALATARLLVAFQDRSLAASAEDGAGQRWTAGLPWLVLGALAGAARFARPEAWALVPVVLASAAGFAAPATVPSSASARALAILGALSGVLFANILGVWATGVLAPQLELLTVARFEQTMAPGPAAHATAVDVVVGVARNAWGQLRYLVVPRQGLLIAVMALLGLPWRAHRTLLALGGALTAATVLVWSTDDPSRFTVAPLALLAPVAAVEAVVVFLAATASVRRRRALRAALCCAWLALAGYAGGREGRKVRRPLPQPPTVVGSRPVALADPWTFALVRGAPAVLESQPSRPAFDRAR